MFFQKILKIDLTVNGKEYLPINSIPKNEFYFDTNNIENKFTYFSVPKKKKIETIKLIFTKYKFIEEILTKNDILEISLVIPHDGQVIIRQPFDENWIGEK